MRNRVKLLEIGNTPWEIENVYYVNREYVIGNREYIMRNREYIIGNREYIMGNREYIMELEIISWN